MLERYAPEQKSRRRRGRRSSTGITDAWGVLIRCASNHGREEFDVDAVVAAGQDNSQDLKRSSVRTQLAAFVTRGLLERPVPGRFKVTSIAMKALGEESDDEEGLDEHQRPSGGPAAVDSEGRVLPIGRESR